MSAVTDPFSAASPRQASASDEDAAASDEALERLLPRYARLGMALAGAEACLVRVRRGDQRWQSAQVGEPEETPGAEADFLDRTRRGGVPLTEGRRYGLPIGRRGAFMVRLPRGEALTGHDAAALADLAALLAREVGGGRERAAADEAARAAAVEVEHQMRNGFAKINAMIDLAAREGLPHEAFVGALKRRLAALGEANEVAIAHGFGPAPLHAVLRGAFVAVLGRNHGEGTVWLDGEPLLVSSAVASVLAPIFGELTADALARGALSEDTPVRLTWAHQEARQRFVFRWEEAPARSDATPFLSPFLRSSGPNTLRAEAMIDPGGDGAGRGPSYRLAVPDRFVTRPA